LVVHPDDPALSTLYCANLIKNGSQSSLHEAEQRLEELSDLYPQNGYILQKLVTASALLGDPSQAIAKINRIHWRVEPPHLEKPVRITVFLAQRQFNRALEISDSLPANSEYGQAIMRKIFLSWAYAEGTADGQRRVAERGLEREIPQSFKNNVPILTMYAQLACIAGDNARFEKTLKLIRKLNQQVAEEVSNADNLFDSWEDFEPDLP
jgi:hypothetical protein